jgi:hypothetical protein
MTEASTENCFGKQQGRFDIAMAARCDRSLPFAAMAAITAMDHQQLTEFTVMFNRTMRWADVKIIEAAS